MWGVASDVMGGTSGSQGGYGTYTVLCVIAPDVLRVSSPNMILRVATPSGVARWTMPVSDTVMLEPLVDFGVLGREVEMSSTTMCADAAFIFKRWLVSVQQVRIETVRRATAGNASARVRRVSDTGGVWVGEG